MKVIREYQVHLKDESEQKRVDELKMYLDEKIVEHQRVLSGQAERKALASSIKFGTSTTKVLTSKTVMARIFLCSEWKVAKSLKKKELIEKMIANYGFSEDIRAKKLSELKQMTEHYLLEREKELVAIYQKELDKALVPLPPAIANFFAQPPVPEEESKQEVEGANENRTFECSENEIMAFLDRSISGNESSAEDEALLTSLLASLL